MARYNVIEYTPSIRGPFEHGPSEAANQRGNKITKRTQFLVTQRKSMASGWFRVRRGGRIRKIRRIGPAGYKSSFAAGREVPRSNRAAELVARTWQCSSVRVHGLPSNKITEQTQFLVRPCFPCAYESLGGLIVCLGRQVVRDAAIESLGGLKSTILLRMTWATRPHCPSGHGDRRRYSRVPLG